MPLPAAAQEDVPLTWSLIPDGLGDRGDTFRLMFVSRNKRDGGSDYISNYNNTVRTAAGNGHPDLDEFRNQFDAVASTRDRDARDNTDTNPNSDGAGEPIYWVRGAKVADHYADFYNGSWDSTARVFEDGEPVPEDGRIIWTGSRNNGTERFYSGLSLALRNSGGGHHTVTGDRLASMTRPRLVSPLNDETSEATKLQGHFYGLSPVFEVQSAPTLVDAKITSRPRDGTTFWRGETIEMTLTFDEPVRFEGGGSVTAGLYLHFSQSTVKNWRPYYVRQDSPNTLVFGQYIASFHRDTDGVCLGYNCSADTLEGTDQFRSSIDNAISGEDRLSFERHSTGYRVDGRSTGLSGGVCDRTWGVRNRLVARVSGADDCSEVTSQDLAGQTSFTVDGRAGHATAGDFGPVASVVNGDFAGLDALTNLTLRRHGIEGLANDVFDHVEDTLTSLDLDNNDIRRGTGRAFSDLSALRNLSLHSNAMSHIDASWLDGLGGLATLDLRYNDLTMLPDGVFEPLTSLTTLRLSGNPGFESFLPAVAFQGGSGTQSVDGGDAVEIEVAPGANPWGGNLTYEWEQIDSTGVVLGLTGAGSKRLRFDAPVLGQERIFQFRLTVTGKGTASRADPRRITREAQVTVRREANVPTVTGVDLVSTADVRDTYRAGETVELEVAYSEDVAVRTRGSGTGRYPRIWALVGGEFSSNLRYFVYDRTEDGNRLIFTYTVARTDVDADGIALCPITNTHCDRTFDLSTGANRATITALDDGTDASLAFEIPPAWSGHKVAARASPGIASIAITSRPGDGGDTFARGETIEATVTWDEDIEVREATGAGNGVVLTAQLESGSGTGGTRDFAWLRRPSPRTMIFAYTVASADADDDGLCIGQSCAADDLVLQGNAQIRALYDGLTSVALAHDAVETPWKVDGSEAGLTGGVCERTLAVRDALVAAAGVEDCSDVTRTVLGRVTALEFSGARLGALKAGDFDGLEALAALDLSDNALASLPAGLFDELAALEKLKLGANALASLPSGVFTPLAALEELRLGGNPLGALGFGTFSGLGALRILDLESTGLTSLHTSVFGALAALEDLDLKDNRLASLPVSVFAGLGALEILDLEGNDLAALPAGVFAGLAALEDLDVRDNELASLAQGLFTGAPGLESLTLQNNRIAALPDGIFEPLGALAALDYSGNPGAPDFRPAFSVAGPARVSAQQTAEFTATPGASPWGSNLVWSWVRTDSDAAALVLAGADTAVLSFEAPSLAANAGIDFTVTATGRGTAVSKAKDAGVTIDATASAEFFRVTSVPVEGDVYRRGEALEVTVPFSERVFVNGAPELSVRMGQGNGGATRALAYVRGTGTTELVFSHTVAQSDRDDDGIHIGADALALTDGATIRNVDLETAVIGNPGAARFSGVKVDGRTAAATGGICDRTREVRTTLVDLAAGVTSCAEMDAAALAALPATLILRNLGITALKAGDFDGLGHVTNLDLSRNALTDITPGVLDPLPGLTQLDLGNNAIARVPAGAFDAFTELAALFLSGNGIAALLPGTFDSLTKLAILDLTDNNLAALPDGIFEPLTEVFELRLASNPGSADWAPFAVATAPGGETEAWEGRTIELDAGASTSGPWGSNLVYEWSTSGAATTTIAFADASAARTTATFTETGGVAGPFTFTLGVSGRGGEDRATASVSLTQVAQPTITGVAFTSTPREGSARHTTYRLGEPIEVTATFSAPVTVTAAPYVQMLLYDDDEAVDDLRRADYVRTVDGRRLVFAYAVQADDDSSEDIGLCKSTSGHAACEARIHLPAGAAVHAADGVVPARLGYTGLAPGPHSYNAVGATAAPTGGVCARTAQVRDAIVASLVAEGAAGVEDCGDVTAAVLANASFDELDLSDAGITALEAGDFEGVLPEVLDLSGNALAGLSAAALPSGGLLTLDVSGNRLTHIAAGLFSGQRKLESLYLGGNRIESIAPGAFAGLSRLDDLQLQDNRLSTLPEGVFEDLRGPFGIGAFRIQLDGNPGSAGFKPVVEIERPGLHEEVLAKQPVTFAARVTGPWGSNVGYAWGQVSTVEGTFSGGSPAAPVWTAPTSDSSGLVRATLTVTGKGGSAHSTSTTRNFQVKPRARATSGRVTSRPRTTAGAHKDTYGRDETIEITLTFDEAVVARGTPHFVIRTGPGSAFDRSAEYDRPASPTQLVFAYTVGASDGINTFTVPSGGLVIAGGEAIENAYGAAASTHQPEIRGDRHAVDGGFTAPRGGICGRTGPVRSALTALVKANDAAVATCADVTAAHLAALTGTLRAEVEALEDGDLAGLDHLGGLDLSGGGLTVVPARELERLVRLETLRLDDNDLATLPDGLLQTLAVLDDLRLGGNPGSGGFGPVARAASEAGAATGGQRVRLDATRSDTGPWGTNVTWRWERVDAQGAAVAPSWLSDAGTARASVAVPLDAAAATARFRLTVTGRGVDRGAGDAAHRSTDTVQVAIRASPAVESVAIVSHPRVGERYGLGERIEIALGYTAPVRVRGAAAIELLVGDGFDEGVREAGYLRTDYAGRLVFGYTVQAPDRDGDGVRGCEAVRAANGDCHAGVVLGTGATLTAADGTAAGTGFTAFGRQAGHRIDGALAPPTGGVCARTAAVRAAIVALAGVASCAGVDAAALAGLTGTLNLSGAGLGALAAGDLDGLGGLTGLELSGNGLSTLPSGVFADLASLVSLDLSGNALAYVPVVLRVLAGVASFEALDLSGNRIAALPANAFGAPSYALALARLDLSGNEIARIDAETFTPSAIRALKVLDLRANRLAALPEGAFRELGALTELDLRDNPGTAGFVPVVDAGPDIADAPAGETVTGLAATVAGPWGGNVAWAWTQASGSAVAIASATTARPEFRAPAGSVDRVLAFRATATGAGTRARASDTVAVTVVPAPKATALDVVSRPQAGTTYGAGEAIEVRATFSHAVEVSGEPALWLAVGTRAKRARYARGTGTRELVFAYTVAAADADTDGIASCTTSVNAGCDGELELDPGESVASAANGVDADPAHPELAAQSGHKVDGSATALTGGICARTSEVRAAILQNLAFLGVIVADCSAVGTAELVQVESIRIADTDVASLTSGDFAGLANLTGLTIEDNANLTTVPPGMFDATPKLESATIRDNGLTSLPAGLFDNNPKLSAARLYDNDLTSLPAGLFDNNPQLSTVDLSGNDLASLPAGLFDNNAKLSTVRVADNSLADLPDDFFANNPRLEDGSYAGNASGFLDRIRPEADAGADVTAYAGTTVTLDASAGTSRVFGAYLSHVWRQSDTSGLAATVAQDGTTGLHRGPRGSATLPAVTARTELAFTVKVFSPWADTVFSEDTVTVTVLPRALVTGLSVLSRPLGGDTYRLGETIEVAARWSEPVTVAGTPALQLRIGSATREALYAGSRDAGRMLVFAYRVAAGDAEAIGLRSCPAGVAGCTGAIALEAGEAIAAAGSMAAAGLEVPALGHQVAHKVDGSMAAPSGGVCERTPEVRIALTGALGASSCAGVTAAALGALTGTLDLGSQGIDALAAGDFAGLGALTGLDLSGNALAALPDGVFEPLGALTGLDLSGNPGTFAPVADAGADLAEQAPGARVALAGTATGPWGGNVAWAWQRTDATPGVSVTLDDPDTAAPAFDAPVERSAVALVFRLTVTGRGGRFEASAEVSVPVRAAAYVARKGAFSSPRANATYALGETIEVYVDFSQPVRVSASPGSTSRSATTCAGRSMTARSRARGSSTPTRCRRRTARPAGSRSGPRPGGSSSRSTSGARSPMRPARRSMR